MLSSAFLRRTLALVGIGAAGASPMLPFATFAMFGATLPAAEASASPTGGLTGDDIPNIPPEDVEDGTGGVGDDPEWPPQDDEFDDVPPEDVEDGTGGIGGTLP